MIYTKSENDYKTEIVNEIFIKNNMKRAKIIINNKQNDLKENIENEKQKLKIKIKFLDNIIYFDSMFEGCKSLSFVNNFQYINTKYLKTINDLFTRCYALLYIDDISNWNLNNVNT